VADQPRLLHRRSELAYTDHPSRALRGEPESVDAATQRRLSVEAGRREEVRRRQRYDELLRRLFGALEELRSEFPQVAHEARAIRRELDRAGRTLGR
jgi:hypothetical protein